MIEIIAYTVIAACIVGAAITCPYYSHLIPNKHGNNQPESGRD